MTELLFFIIAMLASSVKFMLGVAMCITKGVSFWEQVTCTLIGGILGIVIFTYFGSAIREKFQKNKNQKQPTQKQWALVLWEKYGLIGTAFLTPPIISPPFGTALALAFNTPKSKIIITMSLSMLFWSFVCAFAGTKIVHFFSL